MIVRLASLAFTLLIGFVIGTYFANASGKEMASRVDDSPIADNTVPPSLEAQQVITSVDNLPKITSLVRKLDQGIEHRQQLEKELQTLRAEVNQLSDQLAVLSPQLNPSLQDQSLSTNAENFNSDADMVTQLVDNGFTPERATNIKRRFDKLDLDRLYLRDKAVREGWVDTPQFREAVSELDKNSIGLREDIGDQDYDKLLYATGQFNRVVINEVMAESPAQQAGIEAQDIVLAYDGRRIFTWDELREATTQGQEGDTILVDIIRGGEEVQISIPRGPLGVKLDAARLEPL